MVRPLTLCVCINNEFPQWKNAKTASNIMLMVLCSVRFIELFI